MTITTVQKWMYRILIATFILLIFFSYFDLPRSQALIIFTNDTFENDANTITIDADGDATSHISLQFGTTANEFLVWDIPENQFKLSNDLGITGILTTTGNTLILDSDNSGGEISLQFGSTLDKVMSWDEANNTFHLNDSLHIDNELKVGGKDITLDANNIGAGNTVQIIANQGSNNNGILQYNSVTKKWEISNDGGAFSALQLESSSSSLPSIQARRTTSQTLTTTFSDVPFSTVDVASDTSTLELNAIHTERLEIKKDGTYMIYYNAVSGGSATNTHLMTARIQKNGTTPLPASTTINRNYQGEYSSNTSTFIAALNAGDYITLQLQRDATTDITQQDISISVIKLEGVQGPAGPQGPPGSAGTGTNNTFFTLDEDNTSSGVNIALIANQGSDNDGVLQYNSTTKQWEASNDGGAFEPITNTTSILQVYEGGTTTFNGDTSIDWDGTSNSLRFLDSNYTHSTSTNPNQITVNSDGLYRIRYTINWDTSTNTWRTSTCTLHVNGNAPTPIAGTSHAFSRNSIDDTATNNTTFLYTLTAGDYIEISCSSSGTSGSITTLPNQSTLSIQKIR